MMIVDASVVTAWFVSIPTSDRAASVRGTSTLAAPALLKVELTNSLLKYVRAKFLRPDDFRIAVDQVDIVVEHWVPDHRLLPAAAEIALDRDHKIYDCLYLALALERDERLVTADRKLATLAATLSIETELIEPAL